MRTSRPAAPPRMRIALTRYRPTAIKVRSLRMTPIFLLQGPWQSHLPLRPWCGDAMEFKLQPSKTHKK